MGNPRTKQCSNPGCDQAGREMPSSEFSLDKRARDGLQSQCKRCSKQRTTSNCRRCGKPTFRFGKAYCALCDNEKRVCSRSDCIFVGQTQAADEFKSSFFSQSTHKQQINTHRECKSCRDRKGRCDHTKNCLECGKSTYSGQWEYCRKHRYLTETRICQNSSCHSDGAPMPVSSFYRREGTNTWRPWCKECMDTAKRRKYITQGLRNGAYEICNYPGCKTPARKYLCKTFCDQHRAVAPATEWFLGLDILLGYFAADGCLNKSLHGTLSTVNKEKRLIDMVYALSGTKAKRGLVSNKYHTVSFRDHELYNFFLEAGLTPNKSLTMQSINLQKDKHGKEHFWLFLRGLIDGDGYVAPTRSYPDEAQSVSIASGSAVFIEWIQQKLIQEGIPYKDVSISFKGKTKQYSYLAIKSSSIRFIADRMYRDYDNIFVIHPIMQTRIKLNDLCHPLKRDRLLGRKTKEEMMARRGVTASRMKTGKP